MTNFESVKKFMANFWSRNQKKLAFLSKKISLIKEELDELKVAIDYDI